MIENVRVCVDVQYRRYSPLSLVKYTANKRDSYTLIQPKLLGTVPHYSYEGTTCTVEYSTLLHDSFIENARHVTAKSNTDEVTHDEKINTHLRLKWIHNIIL